MVAKYYHQNEDTDSDGLPDWFEWHEFGTLDHNSSSDPDGDGLLMSEERQFGLSAVITDDFLEGGGSIRRSGTIGYIEFQPNEDDDGDGLTKAQELQYGTSDDNTDSDGDGFLDGEEVTAGSDPANADSVPNRPPRDLNSTAVLAFQENQPVGTVIGEFNATDPDGHAITYSLVHRLPSDLNLSLWLDASDFSTITETNGSVSQWADKSGNGNHAVQATLAKMPSYLVSNSSISFDGNDDFLETSGFNPSGPMTIYGVFANAREVLPSTGNYIDVVATISTGNTSGWTLETFNTWSSRSSRKVYLYGVGTSSSVDRQTNGPTGQNNLTPNNFVVVSGTMNAATGQGPLTFGSYVTREYYGKNLLSEFIVCSQIHSSDLRIKVEDYLSRKWNLGLNLVPSKFTLENNGTLKTATVFDFESNASSYTINVQAKDELNATTDGNFTVTLLDVNLSIVLNDSNFMSDLKSLVFKPGSSER